MKKYILTFISLILFFIGLNVDASDCNKYSCITCEYKYKSENIVYEVEAKSNSAGTLELSTSASDNLATINNNIDSEYYDNTSGNEDPCPKQLRPIIALLKKLVFKTLQLVVPIILIIMGTIDFVRAVASSDEKQIKDSTSKFMRRVLTAIIFFFITTIVTIVLNSVAKSGAGSYSDWNSCWNSIN